MRCSCCNANLTDYEAVLRHPVTSEFLDTCRKCLQDIPIVPVEPASFVEDITYTDLDVIFDNDFELDDDDLQSEQ